MVKKIAILGSTGSIGTQALEVIDKQKDRFKIIALTAGNNIELLCSQIEKYKPEYVCIQSKEHVNYLQLKFPDTKILYGSNGLTEISSLNSPELFLVAVSGKIGLEPTIQAIKNKKNIALANKETLVMAGELVMELARKNNVQILPVDSEHSAIFQCINRRTDVKKLIITASGGPFRNSSEEIMKNANLDETLAHPRWKMGKKITVDSATLMNKGLEVIEAHHLFNIDYSSIKVVIHPQSYMHSAVEYIDGSIIAQIGIPSMHIPIQYALTYPDRVQGIETESFDFIKAKQFEFYEPDLEKFPSLKLAIEAGKIGGTATVCLNAANEEAVFAFLSKKIKFLDIYKITKLIFDSYTPIKNPDLEKILEEDIKIRKLTKEIINKGKI
ncbi:MAG: 1-deoxy-D-xylulose-5-phosphate reductoisomerase [Candidatus Gastranaerophilales bacterium]|nr:1-deoxy-D-xylulose-5-phosphate reductoisomerase [Candidatus Gastranaerophilales bacterium]